MPDGFHLTPTQKFFNDWYNVMELYSCADICTPESFLLCPISKEVMENILTAMPVAVSGIVRDGDFLCFVVSREELDEVKKECGFKGFSRSEPVKLKFVRMRNPEPCLEAARQFNSFVKDKEKVNKVANRIVPYARFADRFDF